MRSELLILGTVFAEPNSSAAGSRMLQLIELFQQKGWEITFASAAAESEFAVDLSAIGVSQVSVKLNDSSFDDFVRKLDPQIVMFDRFMTEEQFGWRVAEQCPNAFRVLDTEDLHCLRHARHEALRQNRDFHSSDLFNDLAKREIASIYRCDISLMISEYEVQVLKTVFKVDKALLHYLPFMLDLITEEDQKEWLQFEERQHFVTIGNFLHPPNWDAVQHLKSNIWPLIRKQIPEAEMHVYGAYTSDKHRQLHSEKDGFLILGRAKDAMEVVGKAKVLLAPIRFGAGLKGKLVEAMQCGTPSVTSQLGAEAMHGNLPWSGEVADSPHEFAKAAASLYSDREKWKSAQKNGVAIVSQIYPKAQLGNDFIECINHVLSDLDGHRKQNFIGSMLQHHTMRSTEFMSRWIEEKNKP